MRLVIVLLAIACRREPDAVEPTPFVMHPRTDRPAPVLDEDAGVPQVDMEVTAMITDAKPDKAAGTTIVTVGAGENHGVKPAWIGEVIDAEGKKVGSFTVIDVKPRTTVGASALTPKQLEGKRVRLVSPPPVK